jgi:rhamnosyltransferase
LPQGPIAAWFEPVIDVFATIVVRSFNEGWALRQTLPRVAAQRHKNLELIVIDSGSTDGSVDLIRAAKPAHFIQIAPSEYNPSRVMNRAMELARSDFGIFLNADATPQDDRWLDPLISALQEPRTAAVFSRQIPRPNCQAVYAHDYWRCFGPNRESSRWEHFFSMVSSGLRKDIWAQRGFLETLQYSEDDEYTRWCRQAGYRVVYCPESIVMHSHNYSPAEAYKRSYGESRALAAVWAHPPGKINWPKTVLLGWANDVWRDFSFCLRTRKLREWPHAAQIRWCQRRARLAGFRDGWRVYRRGEAETTKPKGETEGRGARTSPSNPGGRLGGEEATTSRFTIDGGEALERELECLCRKISSAVRHLVPEPVLDGLVLAGGYGRGEGGVLAAGDHERPYNDLEFYVFVRGNRLLGEWWYQTGLRALGEELSLDAGLHVEFKVDSLPCLRSRPVSMFSHDLVSGHKIMHGSGRIFEGCEHHLSPVAIPLSEATRLLFNRCTGLLLARELLVAKEVTAGAVDFVRRNIAKAALACGDALLVTRGLYHSSCRERHQRLLDLDAGDFPGLREFAAIQRLHASGMEFKLHPNLRAVPREELEHEHALISGAARAVWLWVESRRLGREFASPRHYCEWPLAKCPEQSRWHNRVLNWRSFGLRAAVGPRGGRYPRERLLNSLPLLLWDPESSRAELRRHLQSELMTPASDWKDWVRTYKTVWPSYG